MNKPQITLLHHTPLNICSNAIRTCWQSFDRSDNGGEKDRELIERVGNKNKHKSTLEHLQYSFYIKGISRACLQELARHRIASYSVKSSRYTLIELKKADIDTLEQAARFIKLTGNEMVDNASHQALKALQIIVRDTDIKNDIAKYAMPECYLTELTWSINARSLQNFLELRSSKYALWEIQELANAVFDALPEDHKYIFECCMEGEKAAESK
ncbi:thymidylate synthase, flavin-dependent [Helicobacter sp. CLO-3]|uniref:FAD-dependent thymidylate synthase n=1 Tax=unclassified Helicobacter TaxID=2593540 RepID=UPI00080480CE|nr:MULTISPECIES: FAD-dependent thymidylate synthase [unclassified Helicobacter]OBV28723.1 thymidylate synthase, flavin-dependent [Helicobacter sp. CLO-3]OHU81451.1 thymidylate synthase, flavin-dependent [Helicobacter sp. CLO-3]